MQTAAAANEIKSNIGPDYSLADAYDAEYLDTDAAEVEDVDLMSVEQRQALNAKMAAVLGLL
jgi:hypothetical protein